MRLSLMEVTLLMEIIRMRKNTSPNALISSKVAIAMVSPKVKIRFFSFAEDSLGEYISRIRAMKKFVSRAGVKWCRNFPQLRSSRKKIPGIYVRFS